MRLNENQKRRLLDAYEFICDLVPPGFHVQFGTGPYVAVFQILQPPLGASFGIPVTGLDFDARNHDRDNQFRSLIRTEVEMSLARIKSQ